MYCLLAPRKGRKYWTVRIRLPWWPRSRELGTSCERKTDARAVAERMHTEFATESYRVTVATAIDELIGLRRRQKRAAGTLQKLDEKGAPIFRFFNDGERFIHTLHLQDTEGYVEWRRGQGLSDSSIAMELTVLISALRYQARHGKYAQDPKHLWPEEIAHGSGPARTRWLTWDEYLKLLLSIAPEWKDHFQVYVGTGIRLGELYRIRRHHLNGRLLTVMTTKTDIGPRVVPPNGDAYDALCSRAVLAARDQPLFPLPKDRPKWEAQEVAWHRALSAACAAAGIEHCSTNDLRRTFVSWCWQQGVNLTLVIQWMGHKSSRMIREVYAQPSVEQHEREAEKIPSRKRIPVPETPAKKETEK